MSTINLKVKQANERYELSVNQKIEEYVSKLEEKVQKVIRLSSNGHEYWSKTVTMIRHEYGLNQIALWIRAVILAKMDSYYLYFTFGKYKGRIVQDILEEDESYCHWFLHEVRGNDFNTLKILDYLSKCIFYGQQTVILDMPWGVQMQYYKYWLGDPDTIFEEVISELPDKIAKEAREDKDFILEFFSYSGCKSKSYNIKSSDLDCGGMSPWEEMMSDVIDYGDLC